MCLDVTTKMKFKYSKENGYYVGWKDFNLDISSGLHFQNQGTPGKIPVNKWLNEKNYRQYKNTKTITLYNDTKYYKTGFHIYLIEHKVSSYSSRCRKVYFRKPVAHGYEVYDKVVVAKEIFILPLQGKPKCV
jgi:hypothetical protein